MNILVITILSVILLISLFINIISFRYMGAQEKKRLLSRRNVTIPCRHYLEAVKMMREKQKEVRRETNPIVEVYEKIIDDKTDKLLKIYDGLEEMGFVVEMSDRVWEVINGGSKQ